MLTGRAEDKAESGDHEFIARLMGLVGKYLPSEISRPGAEMERTDSWNFRVGVRTG